MFVRRDRYTRGCAFFRRRGGRRLDVEEIEKRVRGVRVVSAERLETELPVHEDDCIARF